MWSSSSTLTTRANSSNNSMRESPGDLTLHLALVPVGVPRGQLGQQALTRRLPETEPYSDPLSRSISAQNFRHRFLHHFDSPPFGLKLHTAIRAQFLG